MAFKLVHPRLTRDRPRAALLDASARLPGDQLVGVGSAIAQALAALHAQRVAHLDVRPNKILIATGGEARLMDLGSGRARAAMRVRAGTDDRVAFQAPEQILNHDHGPAADVYSLGLNLWALASGDLTSMGANPSAQATYRPTHDVPQLDATTAALPAHVTAALAAATRRAPDLRPTAAEFAELLQDS